jgi:UDP-3-O-[3-hydroxymyristoyl] glucosamine N-acyltransferase
MKPSIRAAIDALTEDGLLVEIIGDHAACYDDELLGFSDDRRATRGRIAWISERVLTSSPERASAFRGSFLLAPMSFKKQLQPANDFSVTVLTDSPKLAICLLAARFFPESVATAWPPHSSTGIAADADIHPTATLACGVVIGEAVSIGPFASIGPNTCLAHTDVGERVVIGANCSIGLPGFGYERDAVGRWWPFPQAGRVQIASDVRIGSNTCIDRGAFGDTIIQTAARIDNHVHVAHNVNVGADSLIIAHAMLGGSVNIGDGAWVAPSAAIKNQITVGASAVVGLGAVVLRDVAPGTTVVGNPAKELTPKGKN